MKEVRAYVHRMRVADVIAAIKDTPAFSGGRRNIALYVVKGMLTPLGKQEQHYSLEVGDEIINEYKIEVLCEDVEADQIVDAMQRAGRTGQYIAGWITVSDVERAIPIQ